MICKSNGDCVDKSLIEIQMPNGCGMEAVAPTKEGYKRTARTKAGIFFLADSPTFLKHNNDIAVCNGC